MAILNIADIAAAGTSHWHGSCSIGQSGKTIMFAEYPSNHDKYRTLADGDSNSVGRFNDNVANLHLYKSVGASIRCIKDL